MNKKFTASKNESDCISKEKLISSLPDIDSVLTERRKSVRTIPVPLMVEMNDECSWIAWDEISAQLDLIAASASAVLKMRQLLSNKGNDIAQT